MNFWIALLLVFGSVATAPETSLPKTFSAKIVAVKDGDTYKILYRKEEITLRLEHVDCPEKRQPFGNAARQFASRFCFGRSATIRTTGKKDRYKRLIGEIYVDGKCLNKELVRNGFAWHFTRYSKSAEYARLQVEAKGRNIGLWSDKSSVAPWEWRKMRRENSRTK